MITESQHRPLSPIQTRVNSISNSQPTYGSKSKRTLSPSDELNQHINESKRTRSFDDDDDDDFCDLLDRRRAKQTASQNNNTTISSQSTTGNKQRKPTARKPTIRKLSASQQKTIQ